MQFNPSHHPSYETSEKLPPHIREIMTATFLRRRAAGLNVQFINSSSGQLDEWSFANVSRRDAFVRRMVETNRDYAISA